MVIFRGEDLRFCLQSCVTANVKRLLKCLKERLATGNNEFIKLPSASISTGICLHF